MASWLRLCVVALAALGAHALPAADVDASVKSTCQAISSKISSASSVIYAVSLNFAKDNSHWFVSSSQVPTCVLEAGSPQDVAVALKLIAQNKTPFAVKSGGHASNPGFSSTTGVQIVFVGDLDGVKLSADKSTAEIGMGETWDDVFTKLQGSGVNVVGGRVPGVGVGGYSLGGGYSWKTNQFGLTCDTVQAYNIVLPNATIARIDAASNSDLFFALKGGMNRFGIVTSVEYATHPQPPIVYGGIATYGPQSTQALANATQAFYESNTDPKAQVITTISGGIEGTTVLMLYFYDGSTRPASFAPFDHILPLASTVRSQSFASFVSSIPSEIQRNVRGRFDTLSTSKLTPTFLAAVLNETKTYGPLMQLHGGTTLSYDVEPFTKYGQYDSHGAYPHAGSPLPLNLYFAWIGAANDAYWLNAMHASQARLRQVAISEGILPADFTMYPNYAIDGTSAQDLYGATNAARLAAIRLQVDPQGVMELTGGFDI